MKRRILVVAVALAVALCLAPSPATAHASLDHADPKVGSSLSSSPSAVTLVFTEGVEPAFSRIEVSDSRGNRIRTGDLEHPQADTLRVSLPSLGPETYKVHWAIISVDTHPTEGAFSFSVKAP